MLFFKKKIKNEKETIKEQVSTELVKQLVAEALKTEREKIAQKEKKLTDEVFNVRRERLELEKIKSFSSKSSVWLWEEIQKMEEKHHEHKRLTKSNYDDDDVQAIALKHTINFLKKCVE